MRQDWPYCMKCSQVFRKGHLCFYQMMYWSQASRSPLVAPFMGWFWYVSKQKTFLDSIFQLVVSVKVRKMAKIRNRPRIPMGKWQRHKYISQTRGKRSEVLCEISKSKAFALVLCIIAWPSIIVIMRYPQLPKYQPARSDLLSHGKSFLPA